jgi:deoxyribodipyrimidine photo-lyase
VPDAYLFEPWRMPATLQQHLNLTVGRGAEFDIPEPVIDLQTATREAKAKLHGLRAKPEIRAGKAAIVEKHGSRSNVGANRPNATAKRQKASIKSDKLQIALDF